MSESVTTTYIEAGDDGEEIPVNNLEKTYGYTGGVLTTITITWKGGTYVKTLTYTGGNLTGESIWEKQ